MLRCPVEKKLQIINLYTIFQYKSSDILIKDLRKEKNNQRKIIFFIDQTKREKEEAIEIIILLDSPNLL